MRIKYFIDFLPQTLKDFIKKINKSNKNIYFQFLTNLKHKLKKYLSLSLKRSFIVL